MHVEEVGLGPEPVRQQIAELAPEIEGKLSAARRPQGDLQHRIDAAAAGSVLDLPAGDVAGPILIEKPLVLRGAGMEQTRVEFTNGRARGFAYALIWLDGAGGTVADSDLRGAGHSVVTIQPDSQVEVARNLLAECGYHAVRVTGGTVDMHDNIVMGCRRAGAYLGNQDAHGRIRNNLFTGNLGEIWGYYGSDVLIERNVFYHSKDPAIIFWNTCGLVVRGNSFTGNPAALRQYVREVDPARVGIQVEGNHYWENQQDLQPGQTIGAGKGIDERFKLNKSSSAIAGDPKFRQPDAFDFTPTEGSAPIRDGQAVAGLIDPVLILHVARRHELHLDGASDGRTEAPGR